MKRLVPILLLMTILLCGCQIPGLTPEVTEPPTLPLQTEPEVPELPTEATVPAPTEEYPEYKQQPMLAVSMPYEQESIQNDEDDTFFLHSYQTMQLILEDPQVGDRIILDYLNRMEEVRNTALEGYSDANGAELSLYDVAYSPIRIDQNVLSLSGVESIYVDGRPWQTGLAANYNMVTGEVLTLGSILTDVSAKDSLRDLVIAQADATSQTVELFPDYADCITDRFDREESFDEDWYFTETGLVFYFSTYEIAPYSSGMVALEVPYQALAGIIADEFFPPEEEILIGELNVQLFAQAELADFSQLAEVVIDSLGEKFLLSANGAVHNLRISTGTWDESGTVFIPKCTVFACAALTPGDAVMVQAYIPDTMPNLQIQYESNQQTITCYLSQSGENGDAMLLAW